VAVDQPAAAAASDELTPKALSPGRANDSSLGIGSLKGDCTHE